MAVFRTNKPKPDSAPAIHSILGKDVILTGEIHTGSQSLRIGIGRDKIDSHHLGGDHVVDGVAAGAANTHDLDLGRQFVGDKLNLHAYKPPREQDNIFLHLYTTSCHHFFR